LAVDLNPLNAELNPIGHLLALFGAHPIFHASGIRVNYGFIEEVEERKKERWKMMPIVCAQSVYNCIIYIVCFYPTIFVLT
jgi:hypothetical protein